MYNIYRYHDKTIECITQSRDQLTITFTDGSFLIITARAVGGYEQGCGRAVGELEFTGRVIEKE